MGPNSAKALAMLCLGLGSFVAGILPYWFSERIRQKNPLLLSSLLCFGGGVLLATSLVHMLPEARANLPDYTELTLCAGFFLVYIVDELVHLFHGRSDSSLHLSSSSSVTQQGIPSYGSAETTTLLFRKPAPSASSHKDNEMDAGPCCDDASSPQMCHVNHTEPCNKTSSGLIGLLCALFVHSVLEGLAIGLQETSSKVLLLFGAVSSHKYVVGVCLGAELADYFHKRLCSHMLCVIAFSLGSVIGIAIGIGLEVIKSVKDSIAVPIMQALAAGTLLYVTVSEVLPRERARWHERGVRAAGIAQLFSTLLGFVLMYILTKYLDFD